MDFDPDAPGRGPGVIGALYRWERVDDLPIVGRFDGFARARGKRNDRLFVKLDGDVRIPILYGDLIAALEITDCPECGELRLIRINKATNAWHCENCGHHDELDFAILHNSEWECDECGGPSPPTSMQGCQYCGGQGSIVERGTARVRTWQPGPNYGRRGRR